ncbi:DUF3885 domain-containing protein [Metasolibacillus meyeri]|uniref:DUF3885 domain-containing protein n=1 Tax=Metasolibacillus meyeri TaxID=1071052 RepID=A0AAW9NKL2_9BACL|nr:DUF3885 domain-containing protein [Metasolibacillus meyeri]MEC1177802.1 DUF3885 domain-containing protein [Metasolibacillus meyeri]
MNSYLEKVFPKLHLEPGLFYKWPVGIRYELGTDDSKVGSAAYMRGVYKRATTLFKALHDTDDDLLVVADGYSVGRLNKKFNFFTPYIRNKNSLYKMSHMVFQEDGDDPMVWTHRFILPCKVAEVKYVQMIQALCNIDMGINPQLPGRVYFINMTKNTIFHVYDDRGCDLLAPSAEIIKYMYTDFNAWILDYDREAIDSTFDEGVQNDESKGR